MTNTAVVAEHYSIENILERIKTGLEKAGKNVDSVTIDELSLADEFHIGGRRATEHFFSQLGFGAGDDVLDIGCGIGGGSRFAANKFDVKVKGIDLTESYVRAGTVLNEWVGMEDTVSLKLGDATSLDYPNESFDSAFSMHVCMNIEDKKSVFREVFRILRRGSIFGIYDPMKYGEGELAFPVPWAADATTSHLATSGEYAELLEDIGFDVEVINDRHQFAVDFFEAVKAKMASAGGAPPLGIHVLMGDDAPAKVKNLTANLVNGLVAPFEIIARKP